LFFVFLEKFLSDMGLILFVIIYIYAESQEVYLLKTVLSLNIHFTIIREASGGLHLDVFPMNT
jgi:hypothetical protein